MLVYKRRGHIHEARLNLPFPTGGGEKWGGNGVGDDLYSYGFDGENNYIMLSGRKSIV